MDKWRIASYERAQQSVTDNGPEYKAVGTPTRVRSYSGGISVPYLAWFESAFPQSIIWKLLFKMPCAQCSILRMLVPHGSSLIKT